MVDRNKQITIEKNTLDKRGVDVLRIQKYLDVSFIRQPFNIQVYSYSKEKWVSMAWFRTEEQARAKFSHFVG